MIHINKKIILPFKKLELFAQNIARGNFDFPLHMDRSNIFGSFTESFDLMRHELFKAQKNEQIANQSKKELIASLSHDIKTPVSSILAISEVLILKATADQGKIETIINKAHQIDLLVSDMFHATLEELEFLSIKSIAINSKELVDMIRNSDYEQRASIYTLPECLVLADKLRLQQVFDNIIGNSYKYANTDIKVTSLIVRDNLVICFKDYGKGVASEDFSTNENINLYAGRLPLHDNEIMIRGQNAKSFGVTVGDSVTLSNDNQSFVYLITGLTQDVNGIGSKIYMPLDGYRKFDKNYKMNTIMVYFDNVYVISEFLEYAEEEYSDRIFATINAEKALMSMLEGMTGPIKPVLITIILISLIVLALVLQLILKTNIIMRKTEIGILKSLGFTTGQIVMQTSLSIMPVFIIGSIISGIASYLLINPMMSLALQSVGTMKLEFVIQPTMIIVSAKGFTVFGFISSILVSLKLRKITAYSLIS